MRATVAKEAGELARIDRAQGQQGLVDALVQRRATRSPQDPFDALIGPDGKAVTANLPSWPRTSEERWLRIEADLYRDGDEDDHDALSRDLQLSGGRRLIIGRDVESFADREELIFQTALWGLIAVFLIGPVGGLIVSHGVARRLDDISEAALAVMDGDLGGRVRIKGTGDDFDRLAQRLNAMLDRIAELVGSVARVSDHIAHELRTPLARLRVSLERLHDHPDDADRDALLQRSLAEATRLQTTFDALLRIARLDTGRHTIVREPVRLDKLVRDALEYYWPEAEAREQTVAIDLDEVIVRGDADLLFQAFANLIDNAVKFAPRGGHIAVRLAAAETGPVLTLRDDGPGVSPTDRPRLTERFYRAPGSEAILGNGLGLSLVEAIAGVHDATLWFAGSRGEFEANLAFRSITASNTAR